MKVPPFGFKVLRGPIQVEDIVRWGVWLGWHICGRGGVRGMLGCHLWAVGSVLISGA